MHSSKEATDNGYFDSHCHLNDLNDLEVLVAEANAHGISSFTIPATDTTQWPAVKAMADKFSNCSFALGTHPWFVKNPEVELKKLRQEIELSTVPAIGEIGLDFYPSKPPRPEKTLQIESFQNQLSLAVEFNLPVIIHTVKAHNDTLKLLRQFRIKSGVIHAFNGSTELAKSYTSLGLKLGVGPLLLRSNKIKRVVADINMEDILLETDAPYLGSTQANDNPLLSLLEVAKEVAAVKGLNIEEVRQVTFNNAQALFHLS